jgi:tritrans,polycis-undecaprenyl-diphosphate synthase [geranylgeranyl-diphosphate specific]
MSGSDRLKNDISKVIANTAYHTYEKKLLKEVLENPVPHHVALIMDGNRRFAKEVGLGANEGHVKGKEKLEEVMDWCLELNIRVLTVYAFSTENLTRENDEVGYLMQLFEDNFLKLAKDERIHKYKIRLSVIGQIELLPQSVQDAINVALKATEKYDSYFYNIAIAYGSRQEIIQAIKKVAEKVKEGELALDDITEKLVSSYMYTGNLPDRGKNAYLTSCSGNWHTPSFISPMFIGQDSAWWTFFEPSAATSRGNGVSESESLITNFMT